MGAIVGSGARINSPKRRTNRLQFKPWPAAPAPTLEAVNTALIPFLRPSCTPRWWTRRWVSALCLVAASAPALAAGRVAAAPATPVEGVEAGWAPRIEALATQAARAAFGPDRPVRVEVIVGSLDPRLQLAPCRRVDIYLPAGQRAWGRTRVGLRCVEGPTAWNVFLPLTVKVHAGALVAAQALPQGTVLEARHLRMAEVDWSEAASPVVVDPALAAGRTLLRTLPEGGTLRQEHLKRHQWFAMGEVVTVVAVGQGFSVSGEGTALTPGIEGQPVRVRTESGRTVSGRAVGARRVEVVL